MAEIGSKFGLGGGDGVHFKDPWQFTPISAVNVAIAADDSTTTTTYGNSTAFFTEIAKRGLQEQTNWSANTYKTILSVSSGKGLVAAYIGPQAGGAETHTVEFTVDGVLTEVAITNANTERAVLSTGGFAFGSFTTADRYAANVLGSLNAGKTTFGSPPTAGAEFQIPHWGMLGVLGTPLLMFKQSLLIRAKHSATITNSTATAYSAVMYRLGL